MISFCVASNSNDGNTGRINLSFVRVYLRRNPLNVDSIHTNRNFFCDASILPMRNNLSVASIPRVKYAFCVANVKVKSVNDDSILLTGIL